MASLNTNEEKEWFYMNVLHLFLAVGVLLGIICYALTYYVSKNFSPLQRALTVGGAGLLLLLASIVFIGGWDGIPFGFMAAGIGATSIFLGLTIHLPLIKRIGLIILAGWSGIVLVTPLLSGETSYWVLDKQGVDEYTDSSLSSEYYSLQRNASVRGYSVHTISEGNPAIVLSLGEEMKGANLEVVSVENENERTTITVRSFSNGSTEVNPTIMIGLDELKEEVIVTDTDGTRYAELD